MSSLGNKEVLAKNLAYYMDKNGITRNKLCDDLNLKYSTVSEWINARKYPRIDYIELISNYFGIMKSDLIEERVEMNAPYYLDDIVAQKAQEIYEDPDTRILLDAKRDLSADDLDVVLNMIKALKEKEGK